jgi:hypothetical protein
MEYEKKNGWSIFFYSLNNMTSFKRQVRRDDFHEKKSKSDSSQSKQQRVAIMLDFWKTVQFS